MLAVVALLGASDALVLPSPLASSDAPGAAVSGGALTGRLAQEDGVLRLRVRQADRSARRTRRRARVCLVLAQPGRWRRACARPGRGRVTLRPHRATPAGVRTLAGATAATHRGAVELRLPIRRLGLRDRRVVRWRAFLAAPDGRCERRPCTVRTRRWHRRWLAPPRAPRCGARGPAQVRHRPGGPARVALTFDDGPGPHTRAVLSVLRRERVAATFFLLGRRVARHPGLARRIRDDGHQLGNHSWSHPAMPGGDPQQLRLTQAVIAQATGVRPCVVRPPFGATGPGLVAGARAAGLVSVLWDVDTDDWQRPAPATIAGRATAGRAGSIVLLHDGGGDRSRTVASLPEVIRRYRARGYRFVTVGDLLGLEGPAASRLRRAAQPVRSLARR